MGLETNTTLEYVQHFYLDQFLKGMYDVISYDAKSIQQKSPFSVLFTVKEKYDYVEETYKTILYQWLEQQNDLRFNCYAEKVLIPKNKIHLCSFSAKEIYNFITPQNKNNL